MSPEGHLLMGGLDVVGLAERFGTPVHLVDGNRLLNNYRRFVAAFTKELPDVRVFSSYKTNCIPGVQRILHQAGCGAEVISPYEFWLARALDVPPRDIIYNGPIKSAEALRNAVQAHVGLINIDSEAELDRLIEVAKDVREYPRVGIRLRAATGWGAQFGVLPRPDIVLPLVRKAEASGVLNLCALHCHWGTGLRSPHVHGQAVSLAVRILADIKKHLGRSLPLLDLGGGFGVATVKAFALWETALYRLCSIPPSAPAPARCATLEQFGEMIGKRLVRCVERRGLELPALALEPGRVLTSSAQMLLVSVREVKRRGRQRFALTDGGLQNIAFPLSYEYHHCLLANRVLARKTARYRIVGPLCSPEDVLYRGWPMPRLQEGDILAVLDAGAYFTSFGNNFSYPRPPVVIVADGHATLTRARESFAHLAAMDCADNLARHDVVESEPSAWAPSMG